MNKEDTHESTEVVNRAEEDLESILFEDQAIQEHVSDNEEDELVATEDGDGESVNPE